MNNTSNFIQFFSSPTRSDDRLSTGLMLIPLLYGIPANLLLLTVIFRNEKLRKTPSYIFITSMALSDFGMLFLASTHGILYNIFREEYIDDVFSWKNYVLMFVYQSFWWNFAIALSIMSVNRLSCMTLQAKYQALFTTRKSLFLATCTAAVSIAFASPNLSPCCHLFYFPEGYTTSYWPTDTWYLYFDLGLSSATTVVIVVSYSILIVFLLRSGGQKTTGNRTTRKREMRITFQLLTISLIYVLTFATWLWLPYVVESKWIRFVSLMSWLIQNGIHPTMAFVFNTQVRQELSLLAANLRGMNGSLISRLSMNTSQTRE